MALSRIGKLPIAIPAGTEATLNGNVLTVKGKLGTLSQDFHGDVVVKIEDGHIFVSPANIEKASAKHGLYRALFFNMVKGVSEVSRLCRSSSASATRQKSSRTANSLSYHSASHTT